MPIVYKKAHLSSIIAVWESTEDLNFLVKKAQLSADELALLRNFKSESRKREFLTVRVLLKELFPSENLIISYSKNGKPNLNGNKNISISHTKTYVAVMVGEFKHGGIDLETINERIFKLATKFLNESEIERFCHALRGTKENWVKEIDFFLIKCDSFDVLLPIDQTSSHWYANQSDQILYLESESTTYQVTFEGIDIWQRYQQTMA